MTRDHANRIELDPPGLTRRRFLRLSRAGLSVLALTAAGCSSSAPATPAGGGAPAPSGGAAASAAPAAPAATSSPAAAPAPAPAAKAPAAGAPDVSKEPVTLTFFHYVGANQDTIPDELIATYMRENPQVKIETLAGNNASTFPGIVAAYKTSGKPSVNAGYFNADATTKGDLEDIWLPLDPARIPNMSNTLPEYRRPGDKGVGWGVTPLGLVYLTDKVNPAPASWLDLLDPKYKGKVGLADLLYTFNGLVAINKIKGGTEANPEPGFKAFAEAAKAGQFHSIFPGNQALKDLMTKGEITFCGYSMGQSGPWMDEGMKIAYAVPKEGQLALPLYFQILKGSTPAQVYHCEQMINRLLDPELLARYCAMTWTAPTSAAIKLDAKLANNPAYNPDNIKNAMKIDWKALAEANDVWRDRWNKDVKANLS